MEQERFSVYLEVALEAQLARCEVARSMLSWQVLSIITTPDLPGHYKKQTQTWQVTGIYIIFRITAFLPVEARRA